VSRMSAGTRPPQLAGLCNRSGQQHRRPIHHWPRRRCSALRPRRCDADNSAAIARVGDARDLRPGRECPPRNHLNRGIVGTVMRGGAIGETPEAFLIPLGSVI
jgi:hypothetical protein